MHPTFPKYCSDILPISKNKRIIRNTRQTLLAAVTYHLPNLLIVATITSPTISNTKKFITLSNIKKKQLSCAFPKPTRKTSESSTSSASNGREIKIPHKNEIARKKQLRWALDNGIEISKKSPGVIRNEAQLKGATFLRDLAHSLIYSSTSKQKESPRSCACESVNSCYDSPDRMYNQSQSTTAFKSESLKKECITQWCVPSNEESAIITLIQCECHHKGKVRRQTTGALQL